MSKHRLIMTLWGCISLGNFVAAAIQSPQLTGAADQAAFSEKLVGVDAIINKALDIFNVPGGAVGVIANGQIILCKGYGVRDRVDDLPVTENTLFAIGSCTKAFTTFALGQLVDEGKITWDSPVIQYLPEFRLKDQHATHRLTIRDLVTHRSGMPRHDFVWYNSNFLRGELLFRLQYLEFSSDLREKFQYNNLMYGIAGLVIEKVTGQTWEEIVRARILAPLGMNRSNFSVQDSQMSDDFAQPYQEKDEKIERVPFRNITNVGPAGSINSSVADMVKWLQIQLSEGNCAGVPLINKTTLQEMHTLQMPIPSYPNESIYAFGYGLGWMIGIHNGRYCVSHGGGIDGFISNVALLPRDGIGVVVLSNNSPYGYGFVTAVTNTILDRLIDAQDMDWVAHLNEKCSQLKEAQKKNEIPSETSLSAFDQYVGNYEHPAYGIVKIFLKEGILMAECNRIDYKLQHNNYDSFAVAVNTFAINNLPFQFLRTNSGEICELHIPFEPSVEPIVFKKIPHNELLTSEYLSQFLGVFEGAGVSIEVQWKGNQLALAASGQPSSDLIPTTSCLFAIKGLPGSSAEFVKDSSGMVVELLLANPYGKISFKLKENVR